MAAAGARGLRATYHRFMDKVELLLPEKLRPLYNHPAGPRTVFFWAPIMKWIVYVVDYIYQFMYVEPSLHLWDEAYFIMINDLFDVFLDSVRKYFIENICICIHKGI
ncbi:hypothetical protein STEG23_001850 [Scotinomys teguina]